MKLHKLSGLLVSLLICVSSRQKRKQEKNVPTVDEEFTTELE